MQELFSGTDFEMAQPRWLVLFLGLPVVWWLERRRRLKGRGMMFPGVGRLSASGLATGGAWARLPIWFIWIAVVLAVLSAGRPRMLVERPAVSTRGVDIVLAMDISESMLQGGFGGNSRLEAAKEVALRFIQRRPKDRFGLVLFRGKSFTQCPLTLDHRVLGTLVKNVSVNAIGDEGTAIGSAILAGTNRLKASVSREKIMVLLTDGENNSGEIGPLTAAELAAGEGVRIYAIGAGPDRVNRIGPSENIAAIAEERGRFNEQTLREIARLTGGHYFRVSDKRGLEISFREIDMLERRRFDGRMEEEWMELYPWLVFPALVLLFTGLVLGNTRCLKIP